MFDKKLETLSDKDYKKQLTDFGIDDDVARKMSGLDE